MQINITNLETKMCSNTFNEEFVKAQLERQFSKFDEKALVQVSFKEVKNSGLYEVIMKLEAQNKTFSSSATNNSASKCFAEAKEKLFAQATKQRSVEKTKAHNPHTAMKGKLKQAFEEE